MGTTAVGGIAGRDAQRRRDGRVLVPFVVGGLATIALGIAVGSSIVNGNTVSGNNARIETQVTVLGHQLAATNRKLAATDRRLAITSRKLGAVRARLSSNETQLNALQSDRASIWRSISGLNVSVHKLACPPHSKNCSAQRSPR